MVIYGSTMTIITVTDRFIPGRPLWVNSHLFPGTYNQVAGMATSGSLTGGCATCVAGDSTSAS